MDRAKRTFEKVQKVANALGRHPATIYRWMEAYERSERISVFLRKDRSDRGKSAIQIRLSHFFVALGEGRVRERPRASLVRPGYFILDENALADVISLIAAERSRLASD